MHAHTLSSWADEARAWAATEEDMVLNQCDGCVGEIEEEERWLYGRVACAQPSAISTLSSAATLRRHMSPLRVPCP